MSPDKTFNKHHHHRENRCRTQAYNMHSSTSGMVLSNKSTSLSYGSAKLMGFLWKDYSCLQPMNLNDQQSNLTNATYLARVTDERSYDYTIAKEKSFLERSY